ERGLFSNAGWNQHGFLGTEWNGFTVAEQSDHDVAPASGFDDDPHGSHRFERFLRTAERRWNRGRHRARSNRRLRDLVRPHHHRALTLIAIDGWRRRPFAAHVGERRVEPILDLRGRPGSRLRRWCEG